MKLPKNGISRTVVDRVTGHERCGVTSSAIILTAKKVHANVTEKQVRKALTNCVQRGYLVRTKKGRYKPTTKASSGDVRPIEPKPTQTPRVTTETPEKAKINNQRILGICVFASVVVSAFITLIGK